MAFTAGEITNIANAALDYYWQRPEEFFQTLQDKPLLKWAEGSGSKTFPGGKGNISVALHGNFGDGSGNDVVKGYTHNDTVGFFTPANIVRGNYPWREHHIGLTLTHTELKIDGISVVDTDGRETVEHTDREETVLVNLFQDKLFELGEQYARGMNGLLWGDGTADPKALAGMQYLISVDPSVGVIGGLDQSLAANSWWRNRAHTAAFGAKVTGTPSLGAWGGDVITSNPANGGALLTALQTEYRQLIRYGGKPTMALCGSSFIGAMEIEVRANGNYSMTGFAPARDISLGELNYMGTPFQYAPTLDDLGFAKRCYWFDPKKIFLVKMTEEWRKDHTPARPANQFVLYKSITSTGQMIATQRNSSVVIDIA
jgi:hypothetical protein